MHLPQESQARAPRDPLRREAPAQICDESLFLIPDALRLPRGYGDVVPGTEAVSEENPTRAIMQEG
jgi:hypothetical protein